MNKNYSNLNLDLKDEKIKKLKNELKDREKRIEYLKEKLVNNEDILQDIITEKNDLKEKIQDYDLKMVDDKLNQYQKLQEEQQKIVHRLQVTKNHLDDANRKNNEMQENKKEMQKLIEDFKNRGLLDYIRGKYPESYLKYKEK